MQRGEEVCYSVEALRRVKANEKKERTRKKMQAQQEEEEQIATEAVALGVQQLAVSYEEGSI